MLVVSAIEIVFEKWHDLGNCAHSYYYHIINELCREPNGVAPNF